MPDTTAVLIIIATAVGLCFDSARCKYCRTAEQTWEVRGPESRRAAVTAIGSSADDAAPRNLLFSCATFPADATEAQLVERFGSRNVRTALVEGGGAEGERTEGTIMFGD